jgi:hypothetical protein
MVAGVPLNLTPEMPVNLVPVSVTVVPAGPLFGEKLLTVGGPTEFTVNGVPLKLQPVPERVVTLIGPVVAPPGTVAVICASEFTLKLAATRSKATRVAPVKPDPVIVTLLPNVPLVGVKELMCGSV